MPSRSPASVRETPRARARRHARRAAASASLALSLVLATAVASACGGDADGPPVRVVVPQGAGFHIAADSLGRAGLVWSSRLFRFYASSQGRDRALKPGTYEFRRGTSWAELVDALTEGRGIVRTVTIPEGFSLAAIAATLSRRLEVPEESVMVAASDTAILRRLEIPTPTAEGYLFPARYTFADGTTARQAVRALVEQFERVWKPEWTDRARAMGMTRHQVVTLASIVEKEARIAEERPIISAVYHNRLKAGMLLQADPTVQYALGQHVERVLYKDLETVSAYNTYRNPGLPPGPIASPGAASIEAALAPADVPFLYFVAHPDGHHEFRRTFAEHTRAREQIRRDTARARRFAPGTPRGR